MSLFCDRVGRLDLHIGGGPCAGLEGGLIADRVCWSYRRCASYTLLYAACQSSEQWFDFEPMEYWNTQSLWEYAYICKHVWKTFCLIWTGLNCTREFRLKHCDHLKMWQFCWMMVSLYWMLNANYAKISSNIQLYGTQTIRYGCPYLEFGRLMLSYWSYQFRIICMSAPLRQLLIALAKSSNFREPVSQWWCWYILGCCSFIHSIYHKKHTKTDGCFSRLCLFL